MKKSLFISGLEVLRWDLKENEFLITKNDLMYNCTKERFIDEVLRFENVCLNTWNKELKNDYIALVKEVLK